MRMIQVMRKTVEELAGQSSREHGQDTGYYTMGFIRGYNKAKEFISVKDDLPEARDKTYQVLIRYNSQVSEFVDIVDIEPDDTKEVLAGYFDKLSIEYWRYID